MVLGQVRPTTSQTLHLEDLVGQVIGAEDRPLLARAWQLGSVVEGEVAIPSRSEHARLVCIPVRWQGELVALLTRESALSVGRRPGQLERVYVEVFDRLARMIAQGDVPVPGRRDGHRGDAPGRRRRAGARRQRPGGLRLARTPSTPSTAWASTPASRGCASTRPASTSRR